jgi:hypothetical protein
MNFEFNIKTETEYEKPMSKNELNSLNKDMKKLQKLQTKYDDVREKIKNTYAKLEYLIEQRYILENSLEKMFD